MIPGIGPLAQSSTTSSVQYLANEGVMVTYEDSKILFDPLYDNSYNRYQMVPDAMRAAIMAGTPPFDGVDAVFVSHFHGDHFSATDVLALLRRQPVLRLYAPMQAVAAMRDVATAEDEDVFTRVTGLDLTYGDTPVHISADNFTIGAVFIPHSGWPTARTDVQNIAFRVTLAGDSTIVHLGDADAKLVHFASDEDYWADTETDLALPPYWFFMSPDGDEILDDRIGARRAIGIHAPDSYRNLSEVPAELSGYDFFINPGETRRISN
jgi:L-ascorbate metabolism protein UlaG (beta-lactamase superfamily)